MSTYMYPIAILRVRRGRAATGSGTACASLPHYILPSVRSFSALESAEREFVCNNSRARHIDLFSVTRPIARVELIAQIRI